jgi:penicillin amidase/acyl-homoserine-lactone acylase
MQNSLLALLVAALALAAPALAERFDPKAAIARAERYEATIGRDRWGVPRVHGKTDADAAFALGYAFAEDDFALVQEAFAAGNAHRVTARDESEARLSYLVQLFRIPETADRAWDAQLSPALKAYLDGYADGINLYAARNPRAITRSGLFPLTGKDVVRGALFQTPLFYGMSGTLSRLVAPEQERKLERGQGLQVRAPGRAQGLQVRAPGRAQGLQVRAPDQRRMAGLLFGRGLAEMGSNAFAVAPARSADGATRLIANSHQPLEGPLAWLEATVSSDEGLNFAGGAFPASPVLLIGANPDLAWAATVNRPDLIDTYRLEPDPADPRRYRLDGEARAYETGEARMRVKAGPVALTVRRPTRWSAHGPVLDTKEGPVAIRWASMDEARSLEAQFRLMKARSVPEARAILADNHMPSTYRLFADRQGSIARYYLARMPKRVDGPEWRKMLPGTESRLIWTGFEPFTALPHLENPPEGFLTEANSSPFAQMGTKTDPDPAGFPKRFGIETDLTNRARRATALMNEPGPIDRDRLWAIKMDDAYAPQAFAAELRQAILVAPWAKEPVHAEARALIEAWDLTLAPDNRSAALAMLAMQPIGTALHLGQQPPELQATFAEATAFLLKHHGRLDPPWSAVNRLHRGDVTMALTGGPDVLRAVNSVPDPRTGTLRAITGDGLVILVEWDRAGRQTVSTVSPYGASGDPASPHYRDQMAMFVAGDLKPVPMERAAREAGLVRRYRPQDGR